MCTLQESKLQKQKHAQTNKLKNTHTKARNKTDVNPLLLKANNTESLLPCNLKYFANNGFTLMLYHGFSLICY